MTTTWEIREWDESPHLRFSVTFSGADVCQLSLAGEIDCANASALTAVLDSLHEVGVLHALVDGSDLQFIDCAGLRVLVAQAERFAARGGRLAVSNPGRHLARLMDLTRTTTRLVADASRQAHPAASRPV